MLALHRAMADFLSLAHRIRVSIRSAFRRAASAVARRLGLVVYDNSGSGESNDFKNEFFYDVFNSRECSAYAFDLYGRVVAWNHRMEEITGKRADEVIGRQIAEVYPAMAPSGEEEFVKKALKGEAGDSQRAFYHLNRGSRDYRSVYTPVLSPLGQVVGGAVEIHDFTEECRMEEDRAKLANLESLRTLAGGFAHDFNNFLTVVLGNVSFARANLESNSPVAPLLANAEESADKARDLARELITFARNGTPVREVTDMRELVRKTAEFSVLGSRTKCQFHLAKDLWHVEADPAQLREALEQIVLNAVEAMADGGTISVSGANIESGDPRMQLPDADRCVRISVKDSGVGISREHLGRIFEPEFTTRRTNGGLGLAVSKSIVNRHGGEITVESALESGSTFHLWLPAADEEADADNQPSTTNNITHLIMNTEAEHGRPTRVLVMDDESGIRMLVRRMLESAGYEVTETEEGNEALDKYAESLRSGSPFDVVIMDLTIPGGMGGEDLIRELKAIDPKVRAIVSSGYCGDPIMTNFHEYGFSGVAAKPYKAKNLLSVVSEVNGRLAA